MTWLFKWIMCTDTYTEEQQTNDELFTAIAGIDVLLFEYGADGVAVRSNRPENDNDVPVAGHCGWYKDLVEQPNGDLDLFVAMTCSYLGLAVVDAPPELQATHFSVSATASKWMDGVSLLFLFWIRWSARCWLDQRRE